MIAFIKGTVDSLSEGKMILESHGIGYELNIPASMFDAGVREGRFELVVCIPMEQ